VPLTGSYCFIRVVHRARADGALDPLAGQFFAQQLDGVRLDQDLGVEVLDLVALTARVAVDALMLAPAVEVHAVLEPEPGVRLLDVG
jgi:hypothetical protein